MYFHGNCGKWTQGVITKTEAERFCDVAIREEVPKDRILIEPKATTTYENYKYTKKLLINNHLNPSSFLIVGKPYQERRALAIADIEFPNKFRPSENPGFNTKYIPENKSKNSSVSKKEKAKEKKK